MYICISNNANNIKTNIMTITNLDTAATLGVNIYEIENAILEGQNSFWTCDYEFLINKSMKLGNYKVQENEVVLNTVEGISFLVKKI